MTPFRWPAGLFMPGDENGAPAAPLPRPAAQAAPRGIAPHPVASSRPGASQEAVEPGSYKPPLPEGRRLATFARGESVELRVELATYEGREFVALRIWEKGTLGAWHPTRKGVSVRLRELPELVRVLGDEGVLLAGGRRFCKPRGTP